jgi:hypothetical protein
MTSLCTLKNEVTVPLNVRCSFWALRPLFSLLARCLYELETFEATALKIAKEMVEKRARSAAPNAALHIKLDGIKSRQVLFPGPFTHVIPANSYPF